MYKTMNGKIRLLSLLYSMFLVLLFLSGSLVGYLSRVIYYLAFIIPFAIAVLAVGRDALPKKEHFSFSREKMKNTLPCILPAVSVVILLSVVTSAIIEAISGKTQAIDVGDSFFVAMITHVLIPALLEELLFRYLPMRLLSPHSRRGAVIISALMFAFVHHSLYSIPYAFAAGLIFMTLDIASDSIYPSLIIHFLNNLLSLIIIFGMPLWLVIVLVCLLGISVFFVVKGRKKYGEMIVFAFEKGEKYSLCMEFVLFVLFAVATAVLTL